MNHKKLNVVIFGYEYFTSEFSQHFDQAGRQDKKLEEDKPFKIYTL